MSKKINLLTVGADVELFLQDKDTGEIVSAEGYVKGTKYDPFVFDKDDSWFTTSLDNVAAEFTIPPARKANQFVKNMVKSMRYLNSILPDNLRTLAIPSANLDEKFLMTENAQRFGCEPDFNAYTKSVNMRPICRDHTLRSSGGHIHVGYDKPEIEFNGYLDEYDLQNDDQRVKIVKMLDLFLQVPSIIMEPENKRRELYGKAGAFRPKEYGLEYRTISNYYMNSTQMIRWVYRNIKNAFKFINQNGFIDDKVSTIVEKSINESDKKEAMSLIRHYNLELVK